MRHWPGSALVQAMTCRLSGAKSLPEPMLTYCQLGHLEQNSVTFEKKSNIYIQENAFEDVVCEMAAILSRGGRELQSPEDANITNDHW